MTRGECDGNVCNRLSLRLNRRNEVCAVNSKYNVEFGRQEDELKRAQVAFYDSSRKFKLFRKCVDPTSFYLLDPFFYTELDQYVSLLLALDGNQLISTV